MEICSDTPPNQTDGKAVEIEEVIRSMGASGRNIGLPYAVQSTLLILSEPDRIHYIVKGIYMEVADQFDAKASSIERGIRHMISTIWRNPDHTKIDRVFGYHLFRRPTNGQFLEAVAHYIKRKS